MLYVPSLEISAVVEMVEVGFGGGAEIVNSIGTTGFFVVFGVGSVVAVIVGSRVVGFTVTVGRVE